MNILQGDVWKIDDAEWVVTSVDALRSTCCMSGPLPCHGMQTMALSFVAVKGTLVRRRADPLKVLARLYEEAASIKLARHGRVLGILPEGTPCEHCVGADEHARWRVSRNRDPDNDFAGGSKVNSATVPWVQPNLTPAGVMLHSSRTAYCWDGEGEDPNSPVALCLDCAEDHHERWDDMWSNVS